MVIKNNCLAFFRNAVIILFLQNQQVLISCFGVFVTGDSFAFYAIPPISPSQSSDYAFREHPASSVLSYCAPGPRTKGVTWGQRVAAPSGGWGRS